MITFTCEHRADLLSDAMQCLPAMKGKPAKTTSYRARKLHWSGQQREVDLLVTPAGLQQADTSSGRPYGIYLYKDIESLTTISDMPNIVCIAHGGHGRLHAFVLERGEQMLQEMCAAAETYIGFVLRPSKKSMTMEEFQTRRLGRFNDDDSLTSRAEFTVRKRSPRHVDMPSRLLCLTENSIIERDPATYLAVTSRPLVDVHAFVQDPDDIQCFHIEYKVGITRTYTTAEGSSVLATLLDGARSSGNRDVCVRMCRTNRGDRVGPMYASAHEDIESLLLKTVAGDVGASIPMAVALGHFNANIGFSGLQHTRTADSLFAENKERLISNALMSLLTRCEESNLTSADAVPVAEQFQALRRIVCSKVGFEAFTKVAGCKERIGRLVMRAIRMQEDRVLYSAIDMLGALMQPLHDDFDLWQEQQNKLALLQSPEFLQRLVEIFGAHTESNTGALVISALLDFFSFAVCAPFSETTDAGQFDRLLTMLAGLGRKLFRLFQHLSMAIVKGAGLLMRTIIEEGDAETARSMQQLSLTEGSLLRHLMIALFTSSTDARMLAHRELSRALVALFAADNEDATMLFRRMLPAGLLSYLALDPATNPVPAEETVRLDVRDNLKAASSTLEAQKARVGLLSHWRTLMRIKKREEPAKPVVLRRRRQQVKSEQHWPMFYYQFKQDHTRVDLIWNHRTREELRQACESELHVFDMDRELGGTEIVAWNHVEFEVLYESLSEELKIGDHYVRLLLETGAHRTEIHDPRTFFNDLYHRFLLARSTHMRLLCLQAMSIVYGECFEDVGSFNDAPAVLGMLQSAGSRMERDRLLLFLDKITLRRENVKVLLDASLVRYLVDLLTLAHLCKTTSTALPQSNAIESGDEQHDAEAKEWYYYDAEQERIGPFSLSDMRDMFQHDKLHRDTKCWAAGMDGWRRAADVAVLRWACLAPPDDRALMTEHELARVVLDMLIRICDYYPTRTADGAVIRPLPRCKRTLSDALCLPHIVNVLLTFDPPLVERTARLLHLVMQDNPQMPQLYSTGAILFAMMYTGSNILPITRLLELVHEKQACQTIDASSTAAPSILNSLLPDAMVCNLRNHGAEKFGELFLGDFDTPEAIWNHNMRRFMIGRIALHLSDFTPRLLSNPRALYQYCQIPRIVYSELEDELFCNNYYLRHLTDEQRFLDWPIGDPIAFLKDVLDAWDREISKKGTAISLADALTTLELDPAVAHDEVTVRRAYFRLSMKYHPDKNPEGREVFDKVLKAYEFLTNRSLHSRMLSGPDPARLYLILRAQSIVFARHGAALAPYKYAGYPMLIKTIELEADDAELFRKAMPLLPAAAELAFHTVQSSALNAEELRRENGIQAIAQAFQRCVEVMGTAAKNSDLAVTVCVHILRYFAAAVRFDACCEVICGLPEIVRDTCRCLYVNGASQLTQRAIECVSAMAANAKLQDALVDQGVLWHLLALLFPYDYTLAESGVEKSTDTNRQEAANSNARLAHRAIARLGGFLQNDNATPPNQRVRTLLSAMLTSYLVLQLGTSEADDFLKLLTSNSETPYLIWNQGTRAEIREYIDRQREALIRNGSHDAHLGANFLFSSLRDELKIGGVYVRIYNQQPQFKLLDSMRFMRALLAWISKAHSALFSATAPPSTGSVPATAADGARDDTPTPPAAAATAVPATTPEPPDASGLSGQAGAAPAEPAPGKGPAEASAVASEPTTASSASPLDSKTLELVVARTVMALRALKTCIANNPGTERLCVGHFTLLFAFLRYTESGAVQLAALEAIAASTASQDCVASIADARILQPLLMLLHQLAAAQLTILEVLLVLGSNSKLVAELLQSGGLHYLLDLFCSSRRPAVREAVGTVFVRLAADKLHGPRVKLLLSKFIPDIFLDTMRDSVEQAIVMFDGSYENPELIWNDIVRQRVQRTVSDMSNEIYEGQQRNPTYTWRLPDTFEPVYGETQNELVVGGVYLRLFMKQPTWRTRNPRQFLVALLERLDRASAGAGNEQELAEVSACTALLLSAQPALCDHVSATGHVPKLVDSLSSENPLVRRAYMEVIHKLTASQMCTDSLAIAHCLPVLMATMRDSRDLSGLVAETLRRLFEKNNPDKVNLVAEALTAKLVPFLLDMLDNGLLAVDGAPGIKAHIVQVLKTMALDVQRGPEVQQLLDASPVWSAFKDQRHDLFLTTGSVRGYLTGSTTLSRGYLTAAPTSAAAAATPDAPPPVLEDDR